MDRALAHRHRRFLNRFRHRRVGVDRAGQIFGAATVFHVRDDLADELAGILAQNLRADDFVGLGVGDDLRVTVRRPGGQGAAIGGGLGLACVADVTLVTADASFRLSETSLGIPPAQIAPFVRERVGLTQARRLMLTGARFQGEEAVRLGIGHQVSMDADDLEAQCQVILGHINACAPGANAVTKGILFESLRRPRAEALDFASQGFAQCMLSPEGLEGIAAFVEKRKPSWADQTND